MFHTKWKPILEDVANLDIRLLGYNGEVNAHRIILTSMSEFLFDLILHCKDERPTIHVPDFSVECIQHVMSFIYQGEVIVNEEQFEDLNECAKSLGINLQNITADPLKRLIIIEENVTITDAPPKTISSSSIVKCSECTLYFANRAHLFRHKINFHKVHSTDKQLGKKCSRCSRRFSTRPNLFRHMVNTHGFASAVSHTDRNSSTSSITCNLCGICFSTRANLYRHKRNRHGVSCTEKTYKCKEEDCGFDCYVMKDLREHLQSLHNYSFPMKTIEFKNVTEFFSWKDKYEKEEHVSFVSQRKSTSTKDIQSTQFFCNRDGKPIHKSNGLRNSRTNKIGHHCTAGLWLYKNIQDGTCTANLIDVHYGHTKQLGKLWLQKSDKEIIARQIQQGVPSKTILNKIKSSATDGEMRIHLATPQDIWNIKKKVQKITDDNRSGILLVDECKEEDNLFGSETIT